MSGKRFRDEQSGFEVEIPSGWEAEPDREGGVLLGRPDGEGLLHVMPFLRPIQEEVDAAEELYAFLEEQDIEIEEDEVEDVALGGGAEMALCEYLAEESEEIIYWMVAVAAAPGQLLFASYSAPADGSEADREIVRRVLMSLRPRAAGSAG